MAKAKSRQGIQGQRAGAEVHTLAIDRRLFWAPYFRVVHWRMVVSGGSGTNSGVLASTRVDHVL